LTACTSGRIVLPIYGTIILSEPNIDEFAVEFVYIIILLNVRLCSNWLKSVKKSHGLPVGLV